MEEIVAVLTEGLLVTSGDLCPPDMLVSTFSYSVGCPIKLSSEVPHSAHVVV